MNIKAFHAYRIQPQSLVDFHELSLQDMVQAIPAADPTAGQWRKLGFTNPIAEREVYVGSGGARVLCVEIRERVLPGQVLKTAVAARAARLEEQGEVINKKRIAEIRDVVEAELLGKSHIKSSEVYVLITNNLLIVGTGSPKLADEVLSLIRVAADRVLGLRFLTGHKGAGAWLREVLGTGHDGDIGNIGLDYEEEDRFTAGSSVLLKDGDKSSARFNNTPRDDEAITTALADGFDQVSELQVQWRDVLSVKITDKLVFKSLKFSDIRVAESRDGQDDADAYAMFDATVWLMATYLDKMLTQLEEGMVPLAPVEKTTEGSSDNSDMRVFEEDRETLQKHGAMPGKDIGTSNLDVDEADDVPQSDLDDEEDEL